MLSIQLNNSNKKDVNYPSRAAKNVALTPVTVVCDVLALPIVILATPAIYLFFPEILDND
ncbi:MULTISPECIES: hypothetical protein [Enterobacterales]|uniref:hypothetical protein n=1 Tax=Enterobacterales TaxID=91347 RepID=UPI00084801B3|nr:MULTISPECIES: hypothetical protein [Enterobacterales]WOO49275.1 hypothetical protein R2S03_17685 [Hafnia alvei]MCK9780814.1 hypothetical protein [Proteus columbae]MCT6515750.1 hypothetical protein [Proteus vulgaris]ODQ03329.1 hypothetical protein BGK50_08805 [Shigella sp. FC130]OEI93099.1 hypothetical protein BHE86_04675 [Shigella sp. FC1655]